MRSLSCEASYRVVDGACDGHAHDFVNRRTRARRGARYKIALWGAALGGSRASESIGGQVIYLRRGIASIA